uniref:Uncharacterized protein n=1 Tax=Lotus japonicus TaxID=34305 RepID=I3SY81_LOTJA|nr:unknown [Lotus japonicus]
MRCLHAVNLTFIYGFLYFQSYSSKLDLVMIYNYYPKFCCSSPFFVTSIPFIGS